MRLRVAEGYAYYALYPETYIAAATLFRSGRLPGTAVCVGVRSIGTSLSAVVGAALEAEGWDVLSVTLRPRGPPFERRPVLTPDLAQWIKRRRHADFLIIDEGPGLSGSSMCGVADVISGLGVPDRQITFLPSWPADGGTFNSESSLQRWRRHAKFCCSFEDIWLSRGSSRAEAGRSVRRRVAAPLLCGHGGISRRPSAARKAQVPGDPAIRRADPV